MEGWGTPVELDEPRLRRLVEVGRGLVSELDLETVLNRLLEEARELAGAKYAALGILDETGTGLERFMYVGIDPARRAAIGELPKGRGVLGLLIEDPRPVRLKEVGDHPQAYGFPHGHPEMHSFLGVPIVIRGEVFGDLYLAEKSSGEFDEVDEEATVILAEWAAIAIDNARLYTGIRRQQIHLARQVRGLEAMTDIARAVGGETDLDRVLGTIAKRARALVSARSLVILLRRGERLEAAVAAGEVPRTVVGRRFALGSGLDALVDRGASQRLDDLRGGAVPWDELGVEARAALVMPLQFRGRALGLIAAFDRLTAGPEFTDEDQGFLTGFAPIAATAVGTAQSVAEERLRHRIESSERERARWARELHDETLQGLGAVRVVLSSAARRGTEAEMRDAVNSAIEQIGEEISNLRGLIAELRPTALDQLGLQAALESLAEKHERTSGTAVELEIELDEGPPDPSQSEVEAHLYRVAQEALTNIGKHARADHVRLRLWDSDGELRLMVSDDGVGFDSSAGGRGFGLVGMRERVALAGGTLEIESAPGEGTVLRAALPARRSRQRVAKPG